MNVDHRKDNYLKRTSEHKVINFLSFYHKKLDQAVNYKVGICIQYEKYPSLNELPSLILCGLEITFTQNDIANSHGIWSLSRPHNISEYSHSKMDTFRIKC